MPFHFGLKRPSAYIPVAMSLGALAVVLVRVAVVGVAPHADEGVAAHLWQLLVIAQLPVIAFFVIKWLPRGFRSALPVLALQVATALAAFAPVYFLHL